MLTKTCIVRGPQALALLLLALAFSASANVASAEDENKAWSGKWNNKKFGTSGTIICKVTSKDKSTWKATFSGRALGKPYTYDVSLTATKQGDKIVLKGTHSIRRDRYQWAGEIQGKSLRGQYRSSSGNNGTFSMEEGK